MDLATLPWQDLGAGGIVVLAVLGILTGRIVPRQVLKDVEAQRDVYKQAWEQQCARNDEFGGQVDANTEALRTVERMLTSIMARERTR